MSAGVAKYEPESVLPRNKVELRLVKSPPKHTGRILQVFLHADMRNGHEGLAGMAKKSGIDVGALVPGQYVVFINSANNKMKVFASDSIVAYLHAKPGLRLDLNMVALIPRAFQASGGMNYDKTLEELFKKKLQS